MRSRPGQSLALAAAFVATALAGVAAPASPASAIPAGGNRATSAPLSYFPACSTAQDPGGPCVAAVYGWGDPYSNGFDNCRVDAYNQLMRYWSQGYRSASCQLQNYYPDSYTLLVLYK